MEILPGKAFSDGFLIEIDIDTDLVRGKVGYGFCPPLDFVVTWADLTKYIEEGRIEFDRSMIQWSGTEVVFRTVGALGEFSEFNFPNSPRIREIMVGALERWRSSV